MDPTPADPALLAANTPTQRAELDRDPGGDPGQDPAAPPEPLLRLRAIRGDHVHHELTVTQPLDARHQWTLDVAPVVSVTIGPGALRELADLLRFAVRDGGRTATLASRNDYRLTMSVEPGAYGSGVPTVVLHHPEQDLEGNVGPYYRARLDPVPAETLEDAAKHLMVRLEG